MIDKEQAVLGILANVIAIGWGENPIDIADISDIVMRSHRDLMYLLTENLEIPEVKKLSLRKVISEDCSDYWDQIHKKDCDHLENLLKERD